MNNAIPMLRRTASRLTLVACLLAACKGNDPVKPQPVDVNNAIALSKVLVFTSGTKSGSGSIPTTGSPTSTITNLPSLKVSTGGGTVYIPVAYTGKTAIAYAYVQVQGADTYFIIPVSGTTPNGQIAIPVTLPATLQGNFVLLLSLVSASGNVVLTKTVSVPVETTVPLDCGDGDVTGAAGITLTEHSLNGKSGNVTIGYDTYSLPDRIDVFVDGTWVAGTGTSIAPPPPLSTCINPAAGFVGKSGTFTVPVKSSNKIIQVYVSGCTGSTTAWEYSLVCPR